MKKIAIAITAATVLMAVSPAIATSAHAQISMTAARAKAISYVRGGRILDGELENEKGRWIYSFDIKAPGRSGVEEIQISAVNGSLVSKTHENPAKEQSEQRTEPKEHD